MMFNIRRHQHDWIVALCIIGIFAATYGFVVLNEWKQLKEQALMFELRAIRHAVLAFNYVEERNPDSLDELGNSFFETAKGNKISYIPKRIVDRRYTDPFGHKYLYDNETGWVRSSNKGYFEW